MIPKTPIYTLNAIKAYQKRNKDKQANKEKISEYNQKAYQKRKLKLQQQKLNSINSNIVVDTSNIVVDTSNIVVDTSNIVVDTSNIVVDTSNIAITDTSETSNIATTDKSNIVVDKIIEKEYIRTIINNIYKECINECEKEFLNTQIDNELYDIIYQLDGNLIDLFEGFKKQTRFSIINKNFINTNLIKKKSYLLTRHSIIKNREKIKKSLKKGNLPTKFIEKSP